MASGDMRKTKVQLVEEIEALRAKLARTESGHSSSKSLHGASGTDEPILRALFDEAPIALIVSSLSGDILLSNAQVSPFCPKHARTRIL